MGYPSEEFRKTAVQKFHSRGSRSVDNICKEIGISTSCIYRWAGIYANSPGMNKVKRPQDWNAADKVQAVIEFEKLDPSKQGEYLRTQGLHSEHIAQWKAACVQALEGVGSGPQRAEVSQLKAQNKELERDLRRKDKALAETAALLVLKKKADLIWGTEGNE